jgi:hypothetical protein
VGNEAAVTVRFKGRTAAGKAHLDSEALTFRGGDLRLSIAFKQLSKPNGARWIVRPKGRPEISERATMAAGKAAGLIDVKVVGFSPTHTAETYVIPVAARGSV